MDLGNVLDASIDALAITQMQVLVNALAMTGGLSQFLILIAFIPDLRRFPPALRYLCIGTLSTFGSGSLFFVIGSVWICNPSMQLACIMFSLGFLLQFVTYFMRIRALSNKNSGVSAALVLLIGTNFLANQWQCSLYHGTRLLPCLCVTLELQTPPGSFAALANQGSLIVTTGVFIVLHVYYLGQHRAALRGVMESARMEADAAHVVSKKGGKGGGHGITRLVATMRLMGNTLSSMVLTFVGTIAGVLAAYANAHPLTLYTLIFTNQIAQTFATVAYYRAFADDLRRAESRSMSTNGRSGPSMPALRMDSAGSKGSLGFGVDSRRPQGSSAVTAGMSAVRATVKGSAHSVSRGVGPGGDGVP